MGIKSTAQSKRTQSNASANQDPARASTDGQPATARPPSLNSLTDTPTEQKSALAALWGEEDEGLNRLVLPGPDFYSIDEGVTTRSLHSDAHSPLEFAQNSAPASDAVVGGSTAGGAAVSGSAATIPAGISSTGIVIGTVLGGVALARPSGGSVTPTASGTALDGYLANAVVWRDKKNASGVRNGQWDPGEDYVFTDPNGAFKGLAGSTDEVLRVAPLTDSLRAALTGEPATASTDLATGKPFWGVLSAPGGAKVVSPLTTLLVAVDNNAVKVAKIKSMLGIAQTVDLTAYDPLATLALGSPLGSDVQTAIAVQKASLQVANIMLVAISVVQALSPSAATVSVVDSVASTLAGASSLREGTSAALAKAAADVGGKSLDAASLKAIADALVQANETLGSAVSTSVNTPNDALRELTEGVAYQIVVIDDLASAASKVAASQLPPGGLNYTSYTPDGILEKWQGALESVRTVLLPVTSTLMAADDFALLRGTPGAWPIAEGNALKNDPAPGGVPLKVVGAQAGEAVSASSLSTMSSAGITLAGKYGQLTLKENGDFSYKVTSTFADTPIVEDRFSYGVSGGASTALGRIVVFVDPVLPV